MPPPPPSTRDGGGGRRRGPPLDGGRFGTAPRAPLPLPRPRPRRPLLRLLVVVHGILLLPHCVRRSTTAAWTASPPAGARRPRPSAFPRGHRRCGAASSVDVSVDVDEGAGGGIMEEEAYRDVLECCGGGGGRVDGRRRGATTRITTTTTREREEDEEEEEEDGRRSKRGVVVGLDRTAADDDRDRDRARARRAPSARRVAAPAGGGRYRRRRYCYRPPEWDALPADDKAALATLLSWEALSRWDFDVLRVRELTSDPLLLVGWAVLCPTAQEAMTDPSSRGIGTTTTGDDRVTTVRSSSCDFRGRVTIDPRTVCNFLREVERRYDPDLPFHGNVHAADVVQTVHCLLRMMDDDVRRRAYDPIATFSLLLAATFHDVGHPGHSNLFEVNARTELAMRYDGGSALERMHAAVGESLLFGEGLRREWDVFGGWGREEKARARRIMTTAILGTDMGNHFRELDALRGRMDELDDPVAGEGGGKLATLVRTTTRGIGGGGGGDDDANDGCGEDGRGEDLIDATLAFLLHAADISNPAKKEELAVHWADRALAEFFAQGDKEKEMGLPVSPLCDRDVVNGPDSQIGFLELVIRPTYELLGEMIPRVHEEVTPRIESNLAYWKREKSRLSESR